MRTLPLLSGLIALWFALPLSAQLIPQPSAENPRIQTVRWQAGKEIILTTLPMTGATVMFESGEQIRRVTLDNQTLLDVRISAERDSILVLPETPNPTAGMLVETDRRDYRFSVTSNMGLMAAYLVKFEYGAATRETIPYEIEPTGQTWLYRMRGDREVRPAAISDNGIRTAITFAPDQALPAVFAVGPTGKEEVVNGHMRGDLFVIDRVHAELVFRIDKEKATARRRDKPEAPND